MRTLIAIGTRCLCRTRMHLVKWHLRALEILASSEAAAAEGAALDDRGRMSQMRFEALAIERAKTAHLLQKLRRDERRARVSMASDAYRKHACVACRKRSAGHSLRFNDSAPKPIKR